MARPRTDLLSPTIRNVHRRERADVSQRISNAITRFSGSMTFVWLHVVWFAVWIVVNTVLPHGFDPFPFGLLTLIVSLEAIFLSTFVLISQNQQSARTDDRAKQDFQTNVYSEALSELIAEKLGIDDEAITQRYKRRMQQAEQRERADESNPA